MNWIDYREKLGIAFNDTEKSESCISLLLNGLEDISIVNLKILTFGLINLI